MRLFIRRPWLLGVGALALAAITFATRLESVKGAWANHKTTGAAGAGNRAVGFLREVRPILAQHCFSCHGPADKKAGLRLDQRDQIPLR